MTSLSPRLPDIAFGGDYNPEQWPRATWREDVSLMRQAGVNLVSVGIFSWALLEREEGRYDLDWLREVLDLLADADIKADLATGTASPPPWLTRAHPEVLPVTVDGTRLWPGARQAWCPSSPVFRERAVALVEEVAGAFHDHPALVMWHAGNEYACHNTCCYCDVSAAAFRDWLRKRYGDVAALNDAWGTAFWSQHYEDFEEVLPPRVAPNFRNPAQQLDFRRFSSDEHLACFVAERDVLHRLSPGVPVTTNLMVHKDVVDYWRWAQEVDLVSIDHYVKGADPRGEIDLAFSADVARGLADGRPWLLMEHSTSAVNWQPRNLAKQPGQMRRNSLAHLARGADGLLFFQWRASRSGAEKFHSGMVPHAGTDTRLWREVEALGRGLEACHEIVGSRVRSEVALVFDWEAWWACDLDAHPSIDVRYPDQPRAWHRAFWEQQVTIDIVSPRHDLSGYRLVVVPTLYSATDEFAGRLAEYVEHGGHTVVTYFSGIVDADDRIRLGGYPGAFRDLLGVWTEEFNPLLADQRVRLDDGSVADVWTEQLHAREADVVASYVDGPVPGVPAITRRRVGDGQAWYVATRLAPSDLTRLAGVLCDDAGVRTPKLPAGVEVVRRDATDKAWTFVLNHGATEVELPLAGEDLLSGDAGPTVRVPGGGVAVLAEVP